MATPAERQEEQRRQKLEDIERGVKDGSLVIRKMTPAERKKFPPRQRKGDRRR